MIDFILSSLVSPTFWKCSFPMTPLVCWSVGNRLVGRSFIIFQKDGKLHLHAPIGALVFTWLMLTPLTSMILSPSLSPAASDGESGSTFPMN